MSHKITPRPIRQTPNCVCVRETPIETHDPTDYYQVNAARSESIHRPRPSRKETVADPSSCRVSKRAHAVMIRFTQQLLI